MKELAVEGIAAPSPSHRTNLHSTNPMERLSKELTRRVDTVSVFPSEASTTDVGMSEGALG
jgi:transposase-like protein